jgi:hypothetical protein
LVIKDKKKETNISSLIIISNKWHQSFLYVLAGMALVCSFTAIISPAKAESFNEKAIKNVMDGSLTEANASWWGFEEGDSTKALQAAIRSKAKKVIVPYMGKPWVIEPIFLESNQEIIFQHGVIITAKPGSFKGRTDALFSAVDKRNITLTGYRADLVMRKKEYTHPPYEKGEWRHCIAILGCHNINIFGLNIANSGGDGIYIGRSSRIEGAPNSDNIHIKDVICGNNYRQGISIISVSNLLIENSTFFSSSGTAPEGGVDFEPNNPDEILINCKVKGCIFSNNSGWGISIYLPNLSKDSKPVTIEIEKCQVFGNKKGAVAIVGKSENNVGDPRGSILIKDCKVDGRVLKQKIEKLDVKIE